MDNTHFQYCPKVAVFDLAKRTVLLCRRKGEADYDGTFSFIGGKMEHGDESILAGIIREVSEEVGERFHYRILDKVSINVDFKKRDGNRMILPHFYAEYLGGEITLSEEYSAFEWVRLEDLDQKQPIVENIRWIAPALEAIGRQAAQTDFVEV